ncbi:hypothetical protein First_0092 [Mycobacterium phage First]|uniref:hypothetical protein n=1 Tax=Mycobacterium phage First TaxID=1245814 RepID=UPI0002C112FF|nr:hypothetical protein First_0092 [Mycobacterium phage First]AFV51223.1 hypothetical protein First_0092 [Mycobacterium phage First]
MSNPPNGQHRKAYAGERVLTADRQEIVDGLRVFTNNLDRGVVDLARAEYEWHAGENRYVLWFDVLVDHDYRGEALWPRRPQMQSDDRVTTRFQGKAA